MFAGPCRAKVPVAIRRLIFAEALVDGGVPVTIRQYQPMSALRADLGHQCFCGVTQVAFAVEDESEGPLG